MDLKVLYQISYGMYIVCAQNEGKINGQIINVASQVTADPPNIMICVNKKNLTHEYIIKSGKFTVSILQKDTPMKFIGQFGFKSGRDINKFEGVEYKTGKTGAPVILSNSIGYMECEVSGTLDAGTHTIFIGKMIEGEITGKAEPMTYAYYHSVKGGKSPENAPTYMKVNKIIANGIVKNKMETTG